MRWSRHARIRTVARRGAGIGLLVLVLGFFLVLDWAGAAPRDVVPPEGGGHAWEVTASADGSRELMVDVNQDKPGIQTAGTSATGRRGAAADGGRRGAADTSADARPQAVKAFNPLANLVDGTGFVRFLGFTAISLGFAVVILVFFWSHRRDPIS